MPMVVDTPVRCTECGESFRLQRRQDGFWGVYHRTVVELPCPYAGHWFASPACQPVVMDEPAAVATEPAVAPGSIKEVVPDAH